MKISYHVEPEVEKGRWFRDFEPSKTLAEAMERMRLLKEQEGKRDIMQIGSIAVDSGVMVKANYRIVKVTREIVSVTPAARTA